MQQTASDQRLEGMVCLLFKDHADPLGRLGYSAKEIFWLNFACLPFLPWDGSTGQEIRLSDLLNSFLDLYQMQVEDLSSESRLRLHGLLKQRYLRIIQVIRCPAAAPGDGAASEDTDVPDKWSAAAFLIQKIAHQWQSGPALPFRLVEDI